MRAAIYARYSTELQNARSVEDQLDLCSDFARAQGHRVVGLFHDSARSGTTTHGRDGLHSMLLAAKRGEFDVLIIEALDRLSRDTEDLAGIHKRLTFAGIEIVAVHDGRADALQIGIRGLVSTLFINDLKHKTRRGLAAVVKDGRHAGGRAYGYRPVLGKPGVLEIHEGEAEIVRRIFREYLAGDVPRTIAARLNADGIAPPRGDRWAATTINGNLTRGHGIILNPLYAGHIVWNKTRMVRNPDSGKRVPRANPESEWKTAETPELAIISRDDWEAAQLAKEARSHGHKVSGPKRGRRILTGLLRCGCCGGGMGIKDRRGDAIRIACTTSRESGSCLNKRTYRLDEVERVVINAVLFRLRDPDQIAAFLATAQEERRDAAKMRASAEAEVERAQASLDRLSRAMIKGQIEEDFFEREAPALRAALAKAKAKLMEAPPANVVTLHPAAITEMTRILVLLAKHLPSLDPEEDSDIFEAFRALISVVTIHDTEDGGVSCEITGTLSILLGESAENQSWGNSVVARGRYSSIPPFHYGRFKVR